MKLLRFKPGWFTRMIINIRQLVIMLYIITLEQGRKLGLFFLGGYDISQHTDMTTVSIYRHVAGYAAVEIFPGIVNDPPVQVGGGTEPHQPRHHPALTGL